MKKILIMFLLGLFLAPAFAQKNKKDIVYLKSGGIIKGQLLTYDAEIVKINSAGNEWVFKVADIDSVSRSSTFAKIPRESNLNKDYFFNTSMGVLVGSSANNQKAPFSFMTAMNYKVIDKLYLGAGLGAEFLDETYMPVFGQIQYKFRDTKFTPFVNFQLGYLVSIEDTRHSQSAVYYDYSSSYYPYPQSNEQLNNKGGLFINPSIGFQHSSSDNFGWFFSFGYRHHQLNYSGKDGYKLETNISRLSLNIGFIFN